jgi:hypothetical protein
MSDFGRLRSYDRFLILVHALVWTASLSLRVAIFSQLQIERCRYLDTWELPKAWWFGMCGRATRAVHNGAAACVAAGGGIFENQL